MMGQGALVTLVESDSIAEALGVKPGHRLLTINEHPLRDIIDYRFLSADEELTLHLVDEEGTSSLFVVEKHPDEPLGLEFAEPLFDHIATCANHCSFCFIDGLPAQMRPSLYLRDDDYRLSFLHGNFVTLTNLSEADWDRIGSMRLSPLYVSVHSTEDDLRSRMLGCQHPESIMKQLRRLAAAGVNVHAQIVIVPSLNDGEHLEHTLKDLREIWPAVQSVGVVPVGTTCHRQPPLPQASADQARCLLDQLGRWQKKCRDQADDGWVYAADEWYVLAGRPYPAAELYDDFPQLENGVGMAALWLEQLRECIQELRETPRAGKWALVTGNLAAPLLEEAAQTLSAYAGVNVRVIPVTNQLFGPQVTVTGLLGGRDVLNALHQCSVDEVAIIPEVMLRDELFLDDLSLEELRALSPVPVLAIPARAEALIRAIKTGGDGP